MKRTDYPRCGLSVYEGTTQNGLRVFVTPMPGFQTRFALLATRYGGCDRRFRVEKGWMETPAGIAHYLEHKMFDMPDRNVMERFSALGASPNAFTGSGMTGYLFGCTEHFGENLRELLEYVYTPCFTPESVEKERGIIGQEIRMGLDDPARRVHQELLRALYRNHPVRDPIAGTPESIDAITAELLGDCYRMFYTPENMVLCCAGDLDPEEVFRIAEELTPQGQPAPQRDYGKEEDALPVRVRTEQKMAVAMPLFRFGSKLPKVQPGEETARQQICADLAAELFCGEGSPLYSSLYEEGLINSSFYSGAYFFPEGGVFCVGGRCSAPYEVQNRVMDAAEHFRMDGEMRARCRRVRHAALGNFLMLLDSPENLCHTQADSYLNGYSHMDYPRLCESVTEAEITAMIQESLKPERIAMSVVNPL